MGIGQARDGQDGEKPGNKTTSHPLFIFGRRGRREGRGGERRAGFENKTKLNGFVEPPLISFLFSDILQPQEEPDQRRRSPCT